ncbi:MAG: hypothetical protein K0S65_6799, partial [Labilithrix sp.]|nr:hypothetical protein [Labilithrix sp.]
GRDMSRCLEAYRAAAELGSGDAEHAVALFCMSGGVVPQDLKEGATRLRAAAEKGSVAAKVYLGNLYELGIHYRADAEKADVWYKSAARGARVEFEPGGDDYTRELAELGCVRHVLALVETDAVAGDEKARLLQRARAHGYGLRMKEETGPAEADRPTLLDSLQQTDPTGSGAASEPERRERQRATTTPDTKSARAAQAGKNGPSQTALGLGAFGYALLFTTAGLGAAYAAMLGARELVAHGTPLPGLGTRTHLVFPLVLAIVGVMPALLVYRFGAWFKALLIAAMFGGIGWVAWGMGQVIHTHRPVQTIAFGLAGLLAGLLVLGLLGGTKRQPPRLRRPPTG